MQLPGSQHVRVPPDGSSTSYASVPLYDEDLTRKDGQKSKRFSLTLHRTEASPVTTANHGNRPRNSLMDETTSRETAQPYGDSEGGFVFRLLDGTTVGDFFVRWRRGEFTITPEQHVLLDCWDIVVILALSGTAVVLPFEVALIETPSHGLQFFDDCINFIFMLDMILTFNVAISHHDPSAHVVYERDPLLIIGNYMAVPFSKNLTAGWFWPDIVTLIPWDTLFQSAKGMASVRLLRVLRLVRMLRLVRIAKLFKRWHTYVGFSFALMKIARCASITLILVHWLACAWGNIGQHPEDYVREATLEQSWMSEIPHIEKWEDLTLFVMYTRSLYFCTVVLTTVGFGDIIPKNSGEHKMMVVTILITGLTWAWVVGNVVDVINNSDIYQTNFNQAMDDLNVLMRTRGVTSKLTIRIRKHLYESQLVQRQRHQLQTVTWLSESLQGELAIESGMNEVLHCVWYLSKLSTKEVIELSIYLKPELFSPHEFIMDALALYVIRKGTAMRRGHLLMRNAVFGEDMILASDLLKDSVCPRTLSFVEVVMLGLQELRSVCKRFPSLDAKIRRAQIHLAVRRSFCHNAARLQRFQERQARKQAVANGCKLQRAPTSAWDKMLFGKKMEDNQTITFVQEKLGWVDSIFHKSKGSERERKALVDLTGEVSDLEASSYMSENEARRNRAKIDEVAALLNKSQERSKQQLNVLDGRFDAMEKCMTDLVSALSKPLSAKSPSSRYKSS